MGHVRVRYAKNPFASAIRPRSAVVFMPDDYYLNILVGLPAIAIRIAFVVAANVDPETGIAYCPYLTIRRYLPQQVSNLRTHMGYAIAANIMQRGEKLHTYYLNPEVFRPISINF